MIDIINIDDMIEMIDVIVFNKMSHILLKIKKKCSKNIYKRTNVIGNVTLWKNDKVKCITSKFNSCAVFTELISDNFY